MIWTFQSNLDSSGQKILPSSKLAALGSAVLAACDALDGLPDGIISDPRPCMFQPSSIACTSGDQATCLTTTEVATVAELYGGPRNSSGTQVYPGGLPFGSEPNWGMWVTGFNVMTGQDDDTQPSLGQLLATPYLMYLGFQPPAGPSYDPRSFNFDADPPKLAANAGLFNPTTDLSAFAKANGKLLIYHGWADDGLTPLRTVQYYQGLGDASSVASFAKLYMVPGMNHCIGGPLGNPIDFLTTLEQWVEHGVTPDGVIASGQLLSGTATRTRPVFPYPNVARYSGQGDPNSAASYVEATP
jgi:feruloyl esterase